MARSCLKSKMHHQCQRDDPGWTAGDHWMRIGEEGRAMYRWHLGVYMQTTRRAISHCGSWYLMVALGLNELGYACASVNCRGSASSCPVDSPSPPTLKSSRTTSPCRVQASRVTGGRATAFPFTARPSVSRSDAPSSRSVIGSSRWTAVACDLPAADLKRSISYRSTDVRATPQSGLIS
jgi:hypothetical protein